VNPFFHQQEGVVFFIIRPRCYITYSSQAGVSPRWAHHKLFGTPRLFFCITIPPRRGGAPSPQIVGATIIILVCARPPPFFFPHTLIKRPLFFSRVYNPAPPALLLPRFPKPRSRRVFTPGPPLCVGNKPPPLLRVPKKSSPKNLWAPNQTQKKKRGFPGALFPQRCHPPQNGARVLKTPGSTPRGWGMLCPWAPPFILFPQSPGKFFPPPSWWEPKIKWEGTPPSFPKEKPQIFLPLARGKGPQKGLQGGNFLKGPLPKKKPRGPQKNQMAFWPNPPLFFSQKGNSPPTPLGPGEIKPFFPKRAPNLGHTKRLSFPQKAFFFCPLFCPRGPFFFPKPKEPFKKGNFKYSPPPGEILPHTVPPGFLG